MIFVVVTTNFPAMRDSVNQTTDTEVVLVGSKNSAELETPRHHRTYATPYYLNSAA